jgi:carboxymethylenebutenolidase
MSNAAVASDVRALVDFAAADAGKFRLPVGLVGYCMSGAFAVVAAARDRERTGFVASFYGTRLIDDNAGDDSPHRLALSLRCPVYFAFAEHDPFVPPALVERLISFFAEHGAPHIVETYPDCEHGFAFSDRGTYDAAAATRHWQAIDRLVDGLRDSAGR